MQMQQSVSSPVDNHHNTTSLVHGTPNTTHDTKLMAKLLDAVMVKVKKAYPTKHDDDLRNRVQEQLNKLLPTLQTPDHPPYAFMIEHAIVELNEEGGSSEEAISKFIKATYKDLPWGHCSLLKHHLKKLKEAKAIVSVSGNRYVLLSNGNSPSSLERRQNPKKRRRQMEESNTKHKFCRRDEFTKSQYVAVYKPELVDVKKEVVNKPNRTLLAFTAIEEKDHSKQNGARITSGQGNGSDMRDGGEIIRLDLDKIKNQKEGEVDVSLIGEGNQEDCHNVESLKEGPKEILPAIGEGHHKDQPVSILEKFSSGKLNIDLNGQKEPKKSTSTCQEKASVFGHCGGVSQEILKQCQRIINPVTEGGMEDEQQGITVEKQTHGSQEKYKLVDDSNPLGKDIEFIDNKNQVQEEQPVIIVQKDQSQDRQQAQVVEQTQCYRHDEIVEQSKPSKEQENQVTCQKDQDLVRPTGIVNMEENLTDGERQIDAMEEESKVEKREDESLVGHHNKNQKQVEIFGEQNEGGKQRNDIIGPHLLNNQMVIEEIENDDNSLVQQNGSMGREVQEQEHQFKTINEDTVSRKSEDHLHERQGGLKPLFTSPDLSSFGYVHPGKEKCLEFLNKTIKLQEEFNQKTIKLQEEYNRKIISLQEELFMQLTLGESSACENEHTESRQNAGLRDSAGLCQRPEVNIQVEAPDLGIIERSGHADAPIHQSPIEPERVSASNYKSLPDVDQSVPENLLQRGEKQRRVSEHHDLTEEEPNSHGFSNAIMTWLVQFEKKIFDALGRLSEPKSDRLEKSQPREHDAQLNAHPVILMNRIQPSLCQTQGQQQQQLCLQGPKLDESVAADGPAFNENHQQLEGHFLGNSEVSNSMGNVASNAQVQQHRTMPHRSQYNVETITGQPGRAQGIAMHPQHQQQLNAQVSGKELRSRVITPIFPSYGNQNYTLPVLNNSSTNNYGNAPTGPLLGSGVNGNVVQALPHYGSHRQQLQESRGGSQGRGRGRGRGRGCGSASQTPDSVEPAMSPSQSTPRRRGRPPKTNYSSDVVNVS